MTVSRSKKAMLNTALQLLLEVVTAVCSFILPRLILSHFGSAYNGITNSISQFIGCIALLKSGIGSVTRAALYRPLAENDSVGISEITNATSGFMRKIALIFSGSVVAFAAVYPFFVSEDFGWLFSFTLVIILSLSTFAQYFFGLTYQMVLQADQRTYIISLITIITTVLNTAVASALILMGCGIHIVKLGSALIFIISPVFYNIYVRKRYNINTKVKPNYDLISQRWDAFGHQLAGFINLNTDIMVATIFLNLKEVSVYTIYYMVANAVKKAINSISVGTAAAFGNMLAKKEHELLRRRFVQLELIMCFVSTALLTATAILLVPFIKVYTKGIHDVNYMRPDFAYLVSLSVYFMCMKIPYELMVYAAGEFKNTRNGAFVEAGLNIVLSVILVMLLGLNGIVIGTIVAIAYRTIRYHIFVCNNIVSRSKWSILPYFAFTAASALASVFICSFLPLSAVNSYLSWALWAAVATLIVVAVTVTFGLLFFRKNMIDTLKTLIGFLNFKRVKKRTDEDE